jgi:hypothetical protein
VSAGALRANRRQQTTTRLAVHTSSGAASTARVIAPTGLIVKPWDPNTSNTEAVDGHVTLGGQPVAGAVVSIGGWVNPTPTDASGAFTYPVDITTAARHIATVVGVAHASIGGHPLTAAQRAALMGATSGISVAYGVSDLSTSLNSAGDVVINGRLTDSAGNAPPPVLLYSYELRGVITDANGNPVAGAVVTTRTNDRQYWTQSRPSAANGSYASFLVAADQEGDDPVPMEVGVAVGNSAYSMPAADEVNFAKLQSAVLNIQLPASAGTTLLPAAITPQPVPGAIYQGLVVGVVGGKGGLIKPLSATWPDASGHFQLVLPRSARGLTVKFWEAQRQFYSSTGAAPGQAVNLSTYPLRLPSTAPQGIVTATLPR